MDRAGTIVPILATLKIQTQFASLWAREADIIPRGTFPCHERCYNLFSYQSCPSSKTCWAASLAKSGFTTMLLQHCFIQMLALLSVQGPERNQTSHCESDDEFDVEPEPDPGNVQLFDLMLGNRLINAAKNAPSNDGHRNCESDEPEDAGKREFLL